MYFTIPLLFDIQVNSNFCSGCVGGGVCVCVCVCVCVRARARAVSIAAVQRSDPQGVSP